MTTPLIIDGKQTAASIRAELKTEIADSLNKAGRAPGLAVILVGDDPASAVYVRFKERACAELGIVSKAFILPAATPQQELDALIDSLNAHAEIDSILLQLPLPEHLDTLACLSRISPSKDVDGFHPENVGRLSIGLPCLQPCTPAGVMELLKRYNLSPAGKQAVVIGRSNIVGKPLAMLLAAPGKHANATVTICHSGTKNLAEICKKADFLFPALGKPLFITKDMVKKGAVIIDVGINRVGEKLVGDCDYDNVLSEVHAITPVPGGVGPMTIAMLMKNTVQAWHAHTA